ncbi:MAG: SCO6880 family protein [Acidimicrobiales bacterium]
MGPGEVDAARYRFGPLERRGVVAGWRGGQIGVVAGGLVMAVLVLRAGPSALGIALSLAVVTLAVAAATWPLAGRTAEEWAPDAVRHALSVSRRARRRTPLFGTVRVMSVEVEDGRTCAAVVHDVAARTYTAMVRASGSGFVLSGAHDKAGRVGSWATVLSSLARQGSTVHRLQWVTRSAPDDGVEVRRHLDTAGVLDHADPARRSYRALLQAESAVAQAHEVLLAVTVDAGRATRAVRGAGGGHGGACAVLLRDVASLRRLLADAGIDTGEVLGPGAVAGVVRGAFDDPPSGPSAGVAWPWPMAVVGEWGRAHVDGTWHATYWIAEWPRHDVGPDFLGPLLLSAVRRTVSVVMEPMGAIEAARRVEQARTADIADAELRRRGGFLATARRRREEEVLARREVELADGHAQYRFAGYVTVSARDPESLEDACGRTEQAASRSGLELRRCYGDQARAFTCTLPLGRGLS